MLRRDDWLDLARKVDWDLAYVSERDAFPEVQSGRPWLPRQEWAGWDEPFRTSYAEYVTQQHAKEASVAAVRGALGGIVYRGRVLDPRYTVRQAGLTPLDRFDVRRDDARDGGKAT